jgi:hypothetical protein
VRVGGLVVIYFGDSYFMDFYKASVIDLKWCVTILYSELLAAALRYRYATHKVFT